MSQLLTGNSALDVRDLARCLKVAQEHLTSANFRSELSANVVFTFSWQSNFFLFIFYSLGCTQLPAGIHPLSKVLEIYIYICVWRERISLPPIQFNAISNSRAQLHRCFHFSWMIRPLLRSRMDETRCQKSHVTRRQEEERCNLFHPGRCRGESERECAREVSINPSAGTPEKSSNDSIIGGVSGVGGALWRPHKVRTFKGKMEVIIPPSPPK